jgi:hypothetical protein
MAPSINFRCWSLFWRRWRVTGFAVPAILELLDSAFHHLRCGFAVWGLFRGALPDRLGLLWGEANQGAELILVLGFPLRAICAEIPKHRSDQSINVAPAVLPFEPASKLSKYLRQQRYRLRQSVRTGLQELLTLLLGSTERGVLIATVQEIQRLLDPLLNPKKTKV